LWRLNRSLKNEFIKDLKGSSNCLSCEKFYTQVRSWLKPGWWVQTFSFKSRVRQLPIRELNVSITGFYNFKQGLLWVGGIVFFLWLWFGSVSLVKAFLLGILWWLFFSLPEFYLWQQTNRLQRKIEQEVPYFLDLLTLTLQSGSNLEQALISTTKCYESQLSKKISHRLQELNWGRSVEAILKDLKIEIRNEDFSHFLNSVTRAKKLGVSLSETLAIQVEILRTKRRQKAEALSRTAAVKISLPLVLFIFPALLIIYIGPGILQLLART